MRILHFIPSIDPATGGPVEGLRQRCSIYRKNGHEVEVACLDSPERVAGWEFPAKVDGLGPGWGVYGYSPHVMPWLKANLSRFDVVFVDGVWQYNLYAVYRALAGTDIPWAIFVHGMLDPYFKERYPLKHIKKTIYWHLFLGKIMREAYAVLFTCEEEKILARKSFSRYKVRETVVPYGTFGPHCDLAAASEEFLAHWPALRGKRLALALGRIHPKKATDILIQAYAQTMSEDDAWHLVIAGPDQVGWQKQLEAMAARLGITHRITWTGMLEGTLKWGAFSASEVFVIPSHQENFGIVVAEAQSCGLPVIFSEKVNIWREVMNYWAGLVGEDTIDGTVGTLRRWCELSAEEIAALRIRSKKCFHELFDFNVTSKRAMEDVEYVVRSTARYQAAKAMDDTSNTPVL